MLLNNVISYIKGSKNAAFTLPNGVLNVFLTIIWIVTKYCWPKFPNYLYIPFIAAEAIWINLGIRGLLPEGVKIDVIDYRTLIDSQQFFYIVGCLFMQYDFKVNVCLTLPMFIISQYLLVSFGIDLLAKEGDEHFKDEASINGEISKQMFHVVVIGSAIIFANYFNQL